MLAVAGAVFKELQAVEGYEMLIGKKVQQIEPHYNVTVDEVSNGRINQQTLWASATNEDLIQKLKCLDMYKQVKLLVNINFYEGKPNKIVVLDLLDDESQTNVIEQLFKAQEEKQKAEREMKKQGQE